MSMNKLIRILRLFLEALIASVALHIAMEDSPIIVLPLLFAILFLLFYFAPPVSDRHIKSAAIVLSSFFAISCTLAKLSCLENSLLLFLARFLGMWIFFSHFIVQLYRILSGVYLILDEKNVRVVNVKRLVVIFVAAFIGLFAWFSMWMLYRFPGCLSPDSTWQLMQARGIDPLSNHHPIIHTMVIRLCINLGLKFSSNPSVALATYTIVQFSMLSACFSYLIVTMYRLRVKLSFIIIVFLGFILLPSHATISVTMLKDVWFSGFVLLLCTSVWRISMLSSKKGNVSFWDIFVLLISSLGMCLFRTNGLYAFVFFLPFAVCFLFKKSKTAASMPLLALTLALLITGPLYGALGITPPDTIEALSIPAQHISRAIVEGAQLNEEQHRLLSRVMDVSVIPDVYTGQLSDPIKTLVRETGDQDFLAAHKKDFLRLWIDLGMKNPGAYLRAQIDLTCGYWYPKTDGTVVYPYFTEVEANKEICLLPAPLATCLASIASIMPRLPVIRYFFSNGAAVWLFFTLLFLCIAKKQYYNLVHFVPVLSIWLTLIIATPLDNEFRYAYSIFTTLPLLTVLPFSHVNNHKANAAVPQ